MRADRRIYAVLLVALLLRLCAIPFSDTFTKNEGDDARHFRLLGLNLARGNGYSSNPAPPFTPDEVREPLYPLFLAVCFRTLGEGVRGVQVVQAILDTISVYLVYLLAGQVLRSRPSIQQWGALTAAATYAALPSAIRNCAVLVREPLFVFMLVLSIYLLRRLKWNGWAALGCGALLGAGSLCRANLQLLPLALTPILIRRAGASTKSWGLAGVFVAASCLVVLPWYVRNSVNFGAFSLSPTLGVNLFQRTWDLDLAGNQEPEFRSLVRRAARLPDGLGQDDLYPLTVAYRTKALLPDSNLNAWDIDRRYRNVAVENILRHPWKYLSSSLVEMVRWWYATDNYSRLVSGYSLGLVRNLKDRRRLPLLFLSAAYLLSTILLGLVLYASFRWPRILAFELLVVAYFAITTPLVQICYLSRYWLVAAPFACVAAGAAVAHWMIESRGRCHDARKVAS